MAAWHRRPLTDQYRYLLLDALTLRVKTPDGTKRRLILVAYGITTAGRRELIDYRLVRTESQGTWETFLITLAARGVVGRPLHLITTDGHRGLHAALDLVYPTVPRQACWVHVLRNVAQRLRVRDRERCLHLARRIYDASSRTAAETALRRWVRAWQPVAPRAVACVLHDWEALLAFYAVPSRDWRTRPMTCFANDASCDRIIYAVTHYLNVQWQGRPLCPQTTQNSRRYPPKLVQTELSRQFVQGKLSRMAKLAEDSVRKLSSGHVQTPHGTSRATRPGPRFLSPSSLAGLSALELVVVLAIVALLVGLAAPSYLNYSSNQRVLAATRALSSTIRAAQQEAVTRRTTITLMLSPADVACPDGAASHTLLAEEEVIRRTCLASDLGWASRSEEPPAFQSTGTPRAGATMSIRSTRTGRTHTVTVQADTGAVSDDAR